MELDGIVPDKATYSVFIKQFIATGDLTAALDLLLNMEKV